MNVYDQQLVTDGRILHALGLMLQRDEGSPARHPVATPAALSPGHRCAWCDAATGRKPAKGGVPESHGICPGHHDLILAEVGA